MPTMDIDPKAAPITTGRSRRSRAPLLLARATVVVLSGLVITQAAGWTGHPTVYVLQALTPYLLALAAPIGIAAAVTRRWFLAGAASLILGALVVLAMPILLHPEPAVPGTTRFTITHSNAYFDNPDPDAVAAALLATGSDLLAITEYTAELEAALLARGADTIYSSWVGTPSPERFGVALLSRHRITSSDVAAIGTQTGIVATVSVRGQSVRVVVAHPLPGVDSDSLDLLDRDLRAIGRLARSPGDPTVVVGDFNASRWHPGFRDLLARLTDAHEALGRGWSTSWPADRWFPAFVRLDHILLGEGTTVIAIDDIDIPGSDHRATIARLALVRGLTDEASPPTPKALDCDGTACS
jgi:endonuclease/exonuclease/phosphatase (EEP) superfamily protein YafD